MAERRHQVPAREDYGHGCYRRSILLEATRDSVRGELADDFHHFSVRVHHDRSTVLEATGRDVRVPWTTCPGAVEPLRRMRGASLSLPLQGLLRHTPARAQCTHLHDLTCLAITHAHRVGSGAARILRYDVAMPDRVDRKTRCSLARDGETLLVWQIEGLQIIDAEPAAFVGMQIGEAAFRELLLAADGAEAAWVLQRAIFIGLGRQHDFDRMPTAESFAALVGASCHTYAAERVREGKRIYGSVRDFTNRPDDVLGR